MPMLHVALALVILNLQAAPANAPQRRADSRTWYQAYADGRRAVQQGNWQAAVDSLEASKRAGAPKPGRRIPFYGDVFDDYLPDYYLGIALTNLGRYAEADRAFEAVRASGLVRPNDREYAQFDTQSKKAKAELLALGPSPTTATPANPTGGGAAAGGGTTPAPAGTNAEVVAPPPSAVTTQPAPVQPSPIAANPSTVPNYQPPPLQPSLGGGDRNAAVIRRPPFQSPNTPNQGVIRRTLAPADEEAAIAAYLSGRYDQSASVLGVLQTGVTGSERAYFYLACSRVALAILGQADAGSIADARAILSRAGDPARFTADRRYISPRVLKMLGVTQ
jgi:tetratricopeptide (TPR) repeat protein